MKPLVKSDNQDITKAAFFLAQRIKKRTQRTQSEAPSTSNFVSFVLPRWVLCVNFLCVDFILKIRDDELFHKCSIASHFPPIRLQNDPIPIFPQLSAFQNVYLPVTSFDFFVRLQIAHFHPNFVPKMLI